MPNPVHVLAVKHVADGLLPGRTVLPARPAADRVGNDALIGELAAR